MVRTDKAQAHERAAILHWTASMGAVTAEALADHMEVTVGVARARLLAAAREGLLKYSRPLTGHPALYTVTVKGTRACGSPGLDPCRVTPSNARHLIECARVAAALERCYPDHRVRGERELRRDEHQRGRELASARIGVDPQGAPLLHRPDLVLWPIDGDSALPVAVEVELTVKAPRRLTAICRAWARCRCVAGVLYLVSPEVEHALARAIERADAAGRVATAPLAALVSPEVRTAQSGGR
jgi:hypothetical protein